jgi:hypothetical protein
MWRAWGILLAVLFQDPSAPFDVPEHEFTLRPPPGWVARPGVRPTVVRFLHPSSDKKADAELSVTHLISGNPTPLESFEAQARTHVAERFKGAVIHEDKRVTIGGRPAFRIVYTFEKALIIKTALHRNNLEYYLLDIYLPEDDAGKQRAAAEAAVETFRIAPVDLSPEESEAFGRTREVLKAAKIDPGMLGERWYALHLGSKKVGHQRTKLAESEGLLSFETDMVFDLGDGNRDAVTVRGSFSPDGRVQKVDSDQVKTNDKKERWQFRAVAELRDGKGRASRDMNGRKEEKTFDVGEGVLLSDVAEFVRGRLAVDGRGVCLMKVLSPFTEEPTVEKIEAGGAEAVEIDDRKVQAVVALCRVDRRKTQAYTYGVDRVLLQQGGAKDLFSVRATSKDEALKP